MGLPPKHFVNIRARTNDLPYFGPININVRIMTTFLAFPRGAFFFTSFIVIPFVRFLFRQAGQTTRRSA